MKVVVVVVIEIINICFFGGLTNYLPKRYTATTPLLQKITAAATNTSTATTTTANATITPTRGPVAYFP